MRCKANSNQCRTLISVASISKSLSVIKYTTWSAIKQKEEMAQKRIQEEEMKEIDDRVLEIRRDVDGFKLLNMKMHYKGRGTLGSCKSFVNQQWKYTELCDNLCNKKPLTTMCS